MPEPLDGMELLRIGLETYELHFKFDKGNTLHLGCSFVLTTAEGEKVHCDPAKHVGDLAPLWDCIGSRVRRIDWGREIRIALSNGAEIFVPAGNGVPRGARLGPHPLGEGYDTF